MSEQQDRFDQELDDALASYSDAPIKEGLERRILARVTTNNTRTSPVMSLSLAVCAVAAMWCLIWWQTPDEAMRKHPIENTTPTLSKIEPLKILPSPMPDGAILRTSAAKPKHIPKRVGEPKLPQFPTPFPMGSEERALLRLAMLKPDDMPPGPTSLASPIQPIEVTALEIKPLE